jgi:hypothetical protein
VSIVKSTELFASAPSTLILPAASLNLSLATEIVPAAGNINVDGADANNSVFLIIDTKVPNAVDLDPATDVQSTSKALFTRSEIAVGVAFDADISNTTDTDIRVAKFITCY